MNRTQRIRQHGERLLAIFPDAIEPLDDLYRRLRWLEERAHTFAERMCNEEVPACEQDAQVETITALARSILGAGKEVFYNTDPRGYALKIDDGWLRASGHMLYTDWGGYGILAPDFEDD